MPDNLVPLTPFQVSVIDALVRTPSYRKVARAKHLSYQVVKLTAVRVRHRLRIPSQTLLILYWRCPLFRLGLHELNLLPPFQK